MSLILISEHSKSIYELRLQMKINRYNKTKTNRWDRVHQLSQVERCWIMREVGPTNCSDLRNIFKTINVRNKSK